MNQMFRMLILVMLFSIFGASLAFAGQDSWTGNINVFLGTKSLDEDDWAPAEKQREVGIKLDFKQQSWPVSIALDYLHSRSDKESTLVYVPNLYPGPIPATAEGETSELNFGVRKIWDSYSNVRPFIEGGFSFVHAEFKATYPNQGISASDSDNGVGLWFGGGVYWLLGDHFNIGLELMGSSAEVTMFNVEGNAGGGHFGLLAGYHW